MTDKQHEVAEDGGVRTREVVDGVVHEGVTYDETYTVVQPPCGLSVLVAVPTMFVMQNVLPNRRSA